METENRNTFFLFSFFLLELQKHGHVETPYSSLLYLLVSHWPCAA